MKIERKQLESEQLKTANTNQVPTSSSNSTIKNEEISTEINNSAPINDDLTSNLTHGELIDKETNIICNNNVLIETCKQMNLLNSRLFIYLIILLIKNDYSTTIIG